MEGIEVVVLLDVGGLEDKEKFEKHVKKVWTVLCFDWLKNNSA